MGWRAGSLALGLIMQAAVFGQAVELAVSGGESRLGNAGIGKTAADSTQKDDYSLKGGFRLAFRLTTNSGDHFGHEFGYAYNRTQLVTEGSPRVETGMAIHQGFYDYLAYPTREGAKFRPFLAGGIHFNNYVPPGSSATSPSSVLMTR